MALFDLTANTNARKLMVLNPDFPKDITVNEGTNAVFTVAIAENGRPKEYTYQWYVNGESVPGAVNQTYTRNISDDKGVYSVYCTVSNKAGTITSRVATMVVNKKPVLNASYPENTTVTVGNSVTAKVSISEDGYPANYTYQWYKNGSAVSGETGSSYTFTPGIGSTTVYCMVTNDAGTVTSRTATITANALQLFNYGDYCTSVTGGWTWDKNLFTMDYHPTSGRGEPMNNGTWLNVVGRSHDDGHPAEHGCVGTVNAIDLTKFKTLHILGHTTNQGGTSRIYASKGREIHHTAAASAALPLADGWTVVDISHLSGRYYIAVGAFGNADAVSYFCNVHLE